MQFRVALCSIIYRKSLKLSRNSLGNTTVGQVVNLLSNDVGRFDASFVVFHYIWLGPVETVLITYLMYHEIGWSALIGIAIILLFVPAQGYLGAKMSEFRLRTAGKTDERIRLMNEIIEGIQVIKMYAWERPFGKLVEMARM